MALDLIAELERLLDSLDAAGITHALCGGLALAVHGHPRATMDIDLLLRTEELTSAMDVARRCGFDLAAKKMVFGVRTATPREIHRVSKLDAETGELLSLDLLVVGPGLERVWADRTTASWREREIAIVSRDGLVAMKRLAGRAQDLADIAALEGTDGEGA